MNRICREVAAHLPSVVDGTAAAWRRRLVERHTRRCVDCRAELERQEALAAELADLGEAAAREAEPPPDWLLDRLLQTAEQPGLRGRVAVPARGAVSGARPALSVALLVVAALLGTAAGYLAWRGNRVARARLARLRRARR
ncbi:anti-sigma factor family protein [Nitriliruptor alkaliphilus]|uniref:anti-sigma factor family protein n=1 Tax=Nitriliruptor alkaliphilus TaxID=427918 RepID=UPI000698BF41|nr:zf-HC2 domain-containing protein [Nitriliruptor alkaliphilus]